MITSNCQAWLGLDQQREDVTPSIKIKYPGWLST